MSTTPEWLEALLRPDAYPHSVTEIRMLETHISWIFLTGEWAYKLKKPVNLGFVDFTTLTLRRDACEEEIRLNRRTAPELYDAVVPLCADGDQFRFQAEGEHIIEYAVRMHQFPQEALLAQCLERDELSLELIETLARNVAELHRKGAVAGPQSPFGEPDLILNSVQVCLDEVARTELPAALIAQLPPLQNWVGLEWKQLKSMFQQRKEQGLVRECHGDLHLGNLVLYQGSPTLFDCLEFNPQLRWIDIISDIGFLVMDLLDRKRSELAWRALNAWLEQTGDYAGLSVLKFYLTYRALVRAKVAAIRLRQPSLSQAEEQHQHELLESYLALATQQTAPGTPAIILMQGVSGSGKSFVARELVSLLGAIQIRSDVERKRLLGQWPVSTSSWIPETIAYSKETTLRTYKQLQELARSIVQSGNTAIIDASFLDHSNRASFMALAGDLRVPFVIVACQAPQRILEKRVEDRQTMGQDASDADVEILRQQVNSQVPLSDAELGLTISLDTSREPIENVLPLLRQRLNRPAVLL